MQDRPRVVSTRSIERSSSTILSRCRMNTQSQRFSQQKSYVMIWDIIRMDVILLSGLSVGMIATGIVFVDTVRRGFSIRDQLIWSGIAGGISLGGFITVYVFDAVLYRLYLQLTGSSTVVPVPRELAEGFLYIGLGLGVIAVLAYGFGSRYGPLKPS